MRILSDRSIYISVPLGYSLLPVGVVQRCFTSFQEERVMAKGNNSRKKEVKKPKKDKAAAKKK